MNRLASLTLTEIVAGWVLLIVFLIWFIESDT